MKTIQLTTAAIFALTIAGCNNQSETKNNAPPTEILQPNLELDFSTPDKSLKSFWKIRDQNRERERRLYIEDQPKRKEGENLLRKATTIDVFQTLSDRILPIDSFERDILEVKVESESRAVVTVRIRNITPIPAGAELTKYEEASRRDGDRLRYVMEKTGSDWQVSEMWQIAIYPAGEWRKSWPQSGKPRVGSLTFDGH